MRDSPGTEARRNAGGARALDYALLGVLATLWGTSYTWIKVALQTMAPLTLVAGRLAIATVLLCVFIGVRDPRRGRHEPRGSTGDARVLVTHALHGATCCLFGRRHLFGAIK